MDEKFIIPLNGLAAGETRFSWQAGKEFFDDFGNTEILAADLSVEAIVEKSGRYIGVDCDVTGTLTVECDRCLEALDMPVDTHIALSVKYGSEENADSPQEGERETVFIPESDAELDLRQVVYDYACLSLPMQRVHESGGCNPVAMKYLGVSRSDAQADATADTENNPFAALKGLLQ